MTEITKDISNKIANMGFLCALLVVFIHCPKSTSAMESMTLMRVFHSVLPGALSSVANAFFFTVAGFFLSGHILEEGWWKNEVKKRFHSLFIPYVVLNICWFACMAAYQWPNIRFGETAHPFEWLDILRALGFYGWGIPVNGPLWFVRTLLLLVLTFPLYAAILKRRRAAAWSLVVLIFSLHVVFSGFVHLPGILGNIFVSSTVYRFWTIGYFCLGATLRLHGMPHISRRFGMVLLLTGMVISSFIRLTSADIDTGNEVGIRCLVFFLSCPMMIAGVWSIVPSKPWPKVLTGNAFPIYVLQWPIIMVAYIICGKTGTHNLIFANLLLTLLFLAFVVVATILTAVVLRKNNLLFKLLLGGR